MHSIEVKDDIKKIEVEENVIDFLIKVGVIQNKEELPILKKILGSDYSRIIFVISKYVSLQVEEDDSLKKYMDYYREESMQEYLNI